MGHTGRKAQSKKDPNCFHKSFHKPSSNLQSSPDFPSSHRSRSSSGMSASSFYGGGGDGGGGLGEDGLELTLPHKRSSFSGIKKRRILADLDNLTPAVSAPYKRVDREPEAENVAVGFKNLGQ